MCIGRRLAELQLHLALCWVRPWQRFRGCALGFPRGRSGGANSTFLCSCVSDCPQIRHRGHRPRACGDAALGQLGARPAAPCRLLPAIRSLRWAAGVQSGQAVSRACESAGRGLESLLTWFTRWPEQLLNLSAWITFFICYMGTKIVSIQKVEMSTKYITQSLASNECSKIQAAAHGFCMWISGHGTSQVALLGKNPPANAGDVRDTNSIPGWGRSPGGGHGDPLQCSCLENPTDRGAWRAAVHRVRESDTTEWLSTRAHIGLGTHFSSKGPVGNILRLCRT